MDYDQFHNFDEIDSNFHAYLEKLDTSGENHFTNDAVLIMDFSLYRPMIARSKPMYNPNQVISLVTKGLAVQKIDSVGFGLTEGCLMVIPAGTSVWMENVSPDFNCHEISFISDTSLAPVLPMDVPQCLSLTEVELPVIEYHFNLLAQLMGHYADKAGLVKNVLKSMVSFVSFISDGRSHIGVDADRSKRDTIRSGFFVLLKQKHYPERSVQYYCEQLGVSYSHLRVAIKSATGKTPLEWIDIYTLRAACMALSSRGNDMPIAQLAHKLQFGSASSFSKFFAKHMQVSPSDYHNRN